MVELLPEPGEPNGGGESERFRAEVGEGAAVLLLEELKELNISSKSCIKLTYDASSGEFVELLRDFVREPDPVVPRFRSDVAC